MKKSFLCAIILTGVYLIAFPQTTQAQYAYSYSEIVGDRSSRGVYGYSATYLDYEAGYYYDPAVLSDLLWQYDNETSLDSGYSEGYADLIDAEVWTYAFGYYYQPSTRYEVYSTHFVLPAYYYPSCYAYGFSNGCYSDPNGFSLFSGGTTNGGFFGLPGYFFNPNYYISTRPHVVARLLVGITTLPDAPDPDPTPPPMPSPTPSCSPLSIHLIAITDNPDPGDINGTNQTALTGAIVTLQAVPDSGAEGTYIWSGDFIEDRLGALTPPNYDRFYWTTPGPHKVMVTFTPNNSSCQYHASARVTVVTPQSYDFNGYQQNGSVNNNCAEAGGTIVGLGCGFVNPGIKFNASTQGPTSFISTASDSGIKLVQYISTYARAQSPSGDQCASTRSSEFDVESGWRRDGTDPYNLNQTYAKFSNAGFAKILRDPSNMYATVDSPYYRIDNYTYLRFDARFEMYLVYFTGNPLNPRFQQPLAKVPWNWGGSIMFSSPGVYSSYTLYPPAQLRPSVPTSTIRNSAPDLSRAMEPCSVQSASNPINNSKFFVHQQYTDFLGYEPDQGGWDYWTSQIDYCSDQECTNARRAAVALALYLAAPFMQYPEFSSQNTHAYNDAFVTYCYRGFLRREPDDGGKAFWVSILDNQISTGNCNYTGIAGAFISSDEYRSRFGSP